MKHTISVLVENKSGVLSRISGLFSRRGYNIESLTVGVTNDPEISRMTVIADGDEYIADQITKQLDKQIEVIKVKKLAACNSGSVASGCDVDRLLRRQRSQGFGFACRPLSFGSGKGRLRLFPR